MAQHHHGFSDFMKLAKQACEPGCKLQDFFGRLLSEGEQPTDSQIEQLGMLAASMDEGVPNPEDDAPDVPVGFVFLGQFIDHDITLDTVSSLSRASKPTDVENLRTPRLELDSVYRDGPEGSPYLYDQEQDGYLLTGNDRKTKIFGIPINLGGNSNDLPRNNQGTALIGDPRNDENGLISQFHLLFLRFHNSVLEKVENGVIQDDIGSEESHFEKARRIVRWHYQWIIRNEFLPKVVDSGVLQAAEAGVFGDGKLAPPWTKDHVPLISVEFSVAAYRFGHSQVRSRYSVNPYRRNVDLFRPPTSGLTSFEPVPFQNIVDWSFFFERGTREPQPARKIDTLMATELFSLPFVDNAAEVRRGENSLAFRNLVRGSRTFSLISGEDAATELGVEPIPLNQKVKDAGLEKTPLWFYCLAEAERHSGKLGEVGGQIVAVTLLKLLKEDKESYVNASSEWTPTLSSSGEFDMAQLVEIAS